LKKTFGNLESISDFIGDSNYLGEIKIKVKGTADQLNNLLQIEKLKIVAVVIDKILDKAGKDKKKYFGTPEFTAHLVQKIFEDKVLQLDGDSVRAQNMRDFDFASRDWFAQNEIWGTSEEESFLKFMDEAITKLQKKYQEIALLRNEQFFKIYSFSDGEPFYPDFVLFQAKTFASNLLLTVQRYHLHPKIDHLLAQQKLDIQLLFSSFFL